MCVSMIIGIFKAVLSCLLLCYPCYPCYLLLSVLLVFNFLSQGTWFVLFASSQSILRETRRGGVHISSSAMVTSRARRKVMGLSGAASFLVEETAITPNAVSPTKLIKRFTWMLGCLMFCEYKMLVLLSNQDQHLCWKNIVSRFGLPWRRGGGFWSWWSRRETYGPFAFAGGCQWKHQLCGGTHSLSAGWLLVSWSYGHVAEDLYFGYVWVQACPPAGSCNVAKGRCECVMA